jgi:chromosomal replication initiation ATPase DnaA
MVGLSQQAFDLAGSPDYSFATMIEGESNRAALNYVRGFADWPSPVALIIGPEGSGKTHMGEAFANEHAQARFLDDADRLDEHVLFDSINRALSGETARLLLAASRAPADWGTVMPDLRSRMANVPVFTVEEPGDDILRPILVQLFFNHGRAISPDAVDFMLTRCPRAVAELDAVVAMIEAEAQAKKADVTKNFVSRFLSRQADLFEG